MTRIPLRAAQDPAYILNQRLQMSTAEIGLSVRTTNCLEERGIFTVQELLNCTRDDLLSISNFGEKTLEEVYRAVWRTSASAVPAGGPLRHRSDGTRTLARSFRICGKKRGERRTGSQRWGSVGEALFFAALFLIGSMALAAVLTSYLVRLAEAQAFVSGWGLWLILLILVSLVVTGAGGMVHSIMQVSASAERRSALAKRASDIDLLGDVLPAARDFPTIPQDENLTNSPGTTLAYRLPIGRSPGGKLLVAGLFCLIWNGLVVVLVVLTLTSYLAHESNWFLTLFLVPFAAVGVRAPFSCSCAC